MANGLLAVAAAGDDRRGAATSQLAAEVVGIVAPVRDEPLGEGPVQARAPQVPFLRRWRCRSYVRGVAGREVDDRRAPEHVREDVDLGGLPTAGWPDGLYPCPPLAPCAERCART